MNTFQLGNLSTAKVVATLTSSGYVVSIPFGDGCDYDLILDDTKSLKRVQVKTGRIRNGCVVAYTKSNNGRYYNGVSRNYIGKADLFAIYCPDNDKVYLVSVENKSISLRIDAPKIANKHIRWAKDYEV